MKLLLLTLCFTVRFALGLHSFDLLDHYCDKYVHYEPMCYFYDFSDSCYPWTLAECKILHYSAHEPNCITYICSVSFLKK